MLHSLMVRSTPALAGGRLEPSGIVLYRIRRDSPSTKPSTSATAL